MPFLDIKIMLFDVESLCGLYKKNDNIGPLYYKITKPQVNAALDLLKQNEQLTMNELLIDMKNKYPTFDITPQHLGQNVHICYILYLYSKLSFLSV